MKHLLNISLLALFLVSGTSCKREGCTDNDAENFDPKAKKNDNTCRFEGSAVLWYGQETSGHLVLTGASSLRYFVDNELQGSTAADVYFTGAPACNQNGSITITRDLGGVKGKTYAYRVEDQLGRIVWEGLLNLEANTCIQKELVY